MSAVVVVFSRCSLHFFFLFFFFSSFLQLSCQSNQPKRCSTTATTKQYKDLLFFKKIFNWTVVKRPKYIKKKEIQAEKKTKIVRPQTQKPLGKELAMNQWKKTSKRKKSFSKKKYKKTFKHHWISAFFWSFFSLLKSLSPLFLSPFIPHIVVN